MRKALFAVVLVAASFAGGAVVNGPGLRWAQTLVMNRLGLDGDDEPAAPKTATATATAAAEEIPARPIPPLIVEPARAPAPVAQAPRPEPSGTASKREAPPAPPATASASALPALTPIPAATTQPPDPVAPPALAHDPEPETPPLTVASREPDQDQDKDKDKDKGADPSVRLAAATNPEADAAPAETTAPGAAAPGGGWAEVRETMRKLGVSRYGVEGDPNGRVRFHCLIPLAGRRAVGQHFEAEGDDDLQAARAALKRVTLWKAAGGTP